MHEAWLSFYQFHKHLFSFSPFPSLSPFISIRFSFRCFYRSVQNLYQHINNTFPVCEPRLYMYTNYMVCLDDYIKCIDVVYNNRGYSLTPCAWAMKMNGKKEKKQNEYSETLSILPNIPPQSERVQEFDDVEERRENEITVD